MAWYLKVGKSKIPVGAGRIIGRADVPSEVLLSREHFEIVEQAGQIFLRDLNSTNGTYLEGERVPPGRDLKLKVDDEIKAGKTKFQILQTEGDESLATVPEMFKMDFGLFLAALFLILVDPTLRFGFSVGWWGCFIILSGMLLAFLPNALIWNFVLLDRLQLEWRRKTKVLYCAAVLSCCLPSYFALMLLANAQWKIGSDMVAAKIEYFCLKQFNQRECVRQVNLCPHCGQRMERVKRDQIVERLKTFRSLYPSDAPRTPANDSVIPSH